MQNCKHLKSPAAESDKLNWNCCITVKHTSFVRLQLQSLHVNVIGHVLLWIVVVPLFMLNLLFIYTLLWLRNYSLAAGMTASEDLSKFAHSPVSLVYCYVSIQITRNGDSAGVAANYFPKVSNARKQVSPNSWAQYSSPVSQQRWNNHILESNYFLSIFPIDWLFWKFSLWKHWTGHFQIFHHFCVSSKKEITLLDKTEQNVKGMLLLKIQIC